MYQLTYPRASAVHTYEIKKKFFFFDVRLDMAGKSTIEFLCVSGSGAHLGILFRGIISS